MLTRPVSIKKHEEIQKQTESEAKRMKVIELQRQDTSEEYAIVLKDAVSTQKMLFKNISSSVSPVIIQELGRIYAKLGQKEK